LGQQKKIIEKNNDKACGGGALVQHSKKVEATAVFGFSRRKPNMYGVLNEVYL
jgi:hypothetical protein